jgi:putative nucleotidyltransferase with HDIG domain
MESIRVLVVDDEASLREALSTYFRKLGYQVDTAGSGDEALEKLRQNPFDLMLLDVRMPGMSGIDVVPEALHARPELAIVMLSAMNDATSAAICMQRGALDYLTKPIELTDLGQAVDRALKRRDTLLQNREISQWLKEEVAERTKEVEFERRRLERITVATLEAIVNALEAKDRYLTGHSARVAALAATIATELGMSDDEVEKVRTAGRLHDLGKIGVREAVLDKEGPLTPDEYEHIKQHVVIGPDILAPLEHLREVVELIRSHHEHWDGSGYPAGLAGEKIPVGARVLCAAEIYDALTTPRPYQEKLSPEEATQRLRQLAGTILDPSVIGAIEVAVRRRKTLVFLAQS